MKATDLPELRDYLRTALAEADGLTVALSGSLARGDFRTDDTGTITSDLDLIPIVRRATDVPAARRQINAVLHPVAARFAIDATAAITLLSTYHGVPNAAYVTSMADQAFLANALALDPAPGSSLDDDELLPWMLQPVTYYLSKATHDDPVTNLAKARAATGRLADHLRLTDADITRDMTLTVREVCHLHDVTPLASTAAYLNAPTAPGRFQAVRDLVFMENQGIPFSDSALAVPSQAGHPGRPM